MLSTRLDDDNDDNDALSASNIIMMSFDKMSTISNVIKTRLRLIT